MSRTFLPVGKDRIRITIHDNSTEMEINTLDMQELKANQSDSILFVIRIDDILSRNMSILPRSILPLEDTYRQQLDPIIMTVIGSLITALIC